MAVYHKEWEVPNYWIWLTEINTDSRLVFPSRPASWLITFCGEKVANYNTNVDYFLLKLFVEVPKNLVRKKN